MNIRHTNTPAAARHHRLRLGLRALQAIVMGVVLGCSNPAAAQGDGDLPYSSSGLTVADFEAPAPNPLPVSDGVTLTAQTAIVSGFAYKTYSCSPSAFGVACLPSPVTITSVIDRSKSWFVDPVPVSPDPPKPEDLAKRDSLLDHEQGHRDEAEDARRKAQAEVDRKLKDGTLKGIGFTEAEALEELERKIQEIIDRYEREVTDKNGDGEDDYDQATAHGTKPSAQAEARKRQKIALADPSTNPNNKTGPEGQSRTDKSIHFDAALQRLTIDQDFIIGVLAGGSLFTPDPSDPVLGAEVRLPSLTLESRSIDGLYFFRADGSAPVLQIDAAGVPLLGAGLPYLSYDPLLNLFYGLTDALEATEGASQLIDALLDGLAADPALLGIRFEPDLDFALASQGFTADASSAASNFIGLRLLNPVPEPASGWLVLVALVLAWGAVKPGRLGPALPPRAPCGPGSPGR